MVETQLCRICKFVKVNLLRVYDMDLLGVYDFSQQASSFVRSTAARSATFRRDPLRQLLNPDRITSAVIAAQLEVAYPIFCVLRDEHLSIDRPVCPYFFAWPVSISQLLLASSAIPLLYF